MKHLLVISNNVLSTTNNNGKTIYSFISGFKGISVSQLYLSGEVPRVEGYNYFRISDLDILRGIGQSKHRGKVLKAEKNEEITDNFTIKRKVGRNIYTLVLRDILWHNNWFSKQLLDWLDAIRPDAIFFVAGDALFAYEICIFIQKRYESRLTMYVTDDYIMPRKHESVLERFRRNKIRKAMQKILTHASSFYTISEPMRKAYKKELGYDSYLAVNMAEDLNSEEFVKHESEIILTYTGSFYYNRSDVLRKVALAIQKYNYTHMEKRAKLVMYSGRDPGDNIKNLICIEGASEYRGTLNSEQVKERLNTSDFLIFVESFDEEQIEKVRYSLSTKVTEYMSVGKPIIAIGPQGIGSMDYLKDVALCVTDSNEIISITELLQDYTKQTLLGKKAREKFLKNHNKMKNQSLFLKNVLGMDGATQWEL